MKTDVCWWTSVVLALGALLLGLPWLLDWLAWSSSPGHAALQFTAPAVLPAHAQRAAERSPGSAPALGCTDLGDLA